MICCIKFSLDSGIQLKKTFPIKLSLDSGIQFKKKTLFLNHFCIRSSLHWGIPFKTNIFIPCHLKKCGVLCYTLHSKNAFECPSVRLYVSVSASFSFSAGSIFKQIFFKLAIKVDIGKECPGISDRWIMANKYRVTALDWRKKMFFTLYLWHSFTDFCKLGIRVDIVNECSGIADGLILTNKYRVIALVSKWFILHSKYPVVGYVACLHRFYFRIIFV